MQNHNFTSNLGGDETQSIEQRLALAGVRDRISEETPTKERM